MTYFKIVHENGKEWTNKELLRYLDLEWIKPNDISISLDVDGDIVVNLIKEGEQVYIFDGENPDIKIEFDF